MEAVGLLISALIITGILVLVANAQRAARPVRKPIPVRIDDGQPRR